MEPKMIPTWKVVIIATSHAMMGDTGESTGVWAEELTTPYYALVDAGIQVDVYSIAGGAIPLDPRSLKPPGENEESVERYLKDDVAQTLFNTTQAINEVDVSRYDAVFLPGGHGTMWDYPNSRDLSAIVASALETNKVVAAVCHGPAGLVTARFADGTPVVAGRRVAGFTNSEEQAAGFTQVVPFLLETRLRELGADYRAGPDFKPFAVRDGMLVTGQNPASAELTVRYLIEALQEKNAVAAE
jgi:putative intracellular protease/amidase